MAESRPQPTGPADEFYIGYEDRAAAGIAAWVRRTVVATLVVAAGIAAAFAWLQRPFDAAAFEYGNPRSFTGVVRLDPYPVLEVERPGRARPAVSRYALVAFGKMGADALVADHADRRVRLEGTLIYRDGQTMLELVDGSIETLDGAAPAAADAIAVGRQTLHGEIVDSKCFLGVMKPASEKPHRACASLCIRGGIPPVFVVGRDENGVPAEYFFLTGADGRPLSEEVLPFVGEAIEITGEVHLRGDGLVLAADPPDYRRLSR